MLITRKGSGQHHLFLKPGNFKLSKGIAHTFIALAVSVSFQHPKISEPPEKN